MWERDVSANNNYLCYMHISTPLYVEFFDLNFGVLNILANFVVDISTLKL